MRVSQSALSTIPADRLFEATLRMEPPIAFGGPPLSDVLAGTTAVGASGMRLDIAFTGHIRGEKFGGELIRGVDYVTVRPDLQIELELRAVLVTNDQAYIAFESRGLLSRGPAGLTVVQQTRLFTEHERYAWLSRIYIHTRGLVDMPAKEVTLRGYRA